MPQWGGLLLGAFGGFVFGFIHQGIKSVGKRRV